MRTVDPALWSRKVVKPPIHVTRAWRYRVEGASRFERRLRLSLRDAMRELLRNCSMAGVGSAIDERNPRVISVAGGLLVACCNAAVFSSLPDSTVVLQSAPEPIHELLFPAVALCSYNTISASELDRYANLLYTSANKSYSLASLRRNLLAFSGLITSSSQVQFDANFTQFLREVARETNVTDIIYKLSPKCNMMLKHCAWAGVPVSCARLFAMRMTDVGYCCVFNARYSSEDQNTPPFTAKTVGDDYGLAVVVRESTDDFTYVRRSGEELEMLIFDGSEYPLIRAGIVRTLPVQRNASVFVTLQASVQRGSDSLGHYTDAWRGCTLSAEKEEEQAAGESWSHCVAECRRRAALALCRCTPHTAPLASRSAAVTCSLEHLACLDRHKGNIYAVFHQRGCTLSAEEEEEQAAGESWSHCVAECRRRAALALYRCTPHTAPLAGRSAAVTCSLEHLACLDRHKEKLTYFYPGEEVHESLSQEQADSVECLHCRANCARLRYATRLSTLPFKHLSHKVFLSDFVKDVPLWNSTVLRVYFTSSDQPLYMVEPYMHIHEVISFVSCQWVVVAGATVVTALEVVYHCTVRWRHHYQRRTHQLARFKSSR